MISMISEIVRALSMEPFISAILETNRFSRSIVTDSSISNISATSSKSWANLSWMSSKSLRYFPGIMTGVVVAEEKQ